MRIQIGDYVLRSDDYNFWIESAGKINKDGKKTAGRRLTGYCSTWSELMQSFARKGLQRSDAETMRKLMEDVSKLGRDAVLLGIAAKENDFSKEGQGSEKTSAS